MSEIITVGLDLAKNVFQRTTLMHLVVQCCARSGGEIRYLPSPGSCGYASWRWNAAAAPTSGAAKSASRATRRGSPYPPMSSPS